MIEVCKLLLTVQCRNTDPKTDQRH
uniref:Uncharacterized protein n=1 Tax=Anguilla anguilla TaxID=7936 RepID=A0A0E9SDS3_ANGAN